MFIIEVSSKLIPKEINPNNYLPFQYQAWKYYIYHHYNIYWWNISFICWKKILQLINDLFKRIPFLRTIYSAINQMTESFTNKNKVKKVLF